MTEHQPTTPAFTTAIAQQAGIIQSNLEDILLRNPGAPVALRAALVRVIGKCMPLSNVESLERLRSVYEPPEVVADRIVRED